MQLETPLVQRLREHLMEQAGDAMGPLHGGSAAQFGSVEEAAVVERFRPFGELLFLVAKADGKIDEDEQALMVGAFHVLTSGRVQKSVLIELESQLARALLTEGLEARLEVVCNALSKDREDAELALSLAGAVALADRRVDFREAQLIAKLASWLGISPKQANEILTTGHPSLPPRPPA